MNSKTNNPTSQKLVLNTKTCVSDEKKGDKEYTYVELWVISREDNVAADLLARNSFNYGLGIHVVSKTDAVHLLKDVVGS